MELTKLELDVTDATQSLVFYVPFILTGRSLVFRNNFTTVTTNIVYFVTDTDDVTECVSASIFGLYLVITLV